MSVPSALSGVSVAEAVDKEMVSVMYVDAIFRCCRRILLFCHFVLTPVCVPC